MKVCNLNKDKEPTRESWQACTTSLRNLHLAHSRFSDREWQVSSKQNVMVSGGGAPVVVIHRKVESSSLLRCDRGDSQQKKKADKRDLGSTYEAFAAVSRRFT